MSGRGLDSGWGQSPSQAPLPTLKLGREPQKPSPKLSSPQFLGLGGVRGGHSPIHNTQRGWAKGLEEAQGVVVEAPSCGKKRGGDKEGL